MDYAYMPEAFVKDLLGGAIKCGNIPYKNEVR